MTASPFRPGLRAVGRLALVAALPAGALSPSPEISARLTQIGGVVEILGAGVRGRPAASAWQVVQGGATVRVPAQGFAGVVCSNRRYLLLEGPVVWTLTAKSCDAGRLLTEAQYALVAPRAGRFEVVEGMMVVDRELRSVRGDNPFAPTVFSLRNGALPSLRPTLRWLAGQGAEEYLVEWQRDQATEHRFRLSAAEASCRREPDGLNLCSFPWPAEAPDLAQDAEYVLTVSARNPVSPNWFADPPVEVRTPRPEDGAQLQAARNELRNAGLLGEDLLMAEAGLFASRGIYSEAVAIYRQLHAGTLSAELGVTLADLYLVTGLDSLAEPLYQGALAGGAVPVRAAAAFGLARIAYERQSYCEATGYFELARQGYAEQGLGREAEAASRGLARSVEQSADSLRKSP